MRLCGDPRTAKPLTCLAGHRYTCPLLPLSPAGRKRWRLHRPLDGFKLPNKPSEDLDEEVIGRPVMEVDMQVGGRRPTQAASLSMCGGDGHSTSAAA